MRASAWYRFGDLMSGGNGEPGREILNYAHPLHSGAGERVRQEVAGKPKDRPASGLEEPGKGPRYRFAAQQSTKSAPKPASAPARPSSTKLPSSITSSPSPSSQPATTSARTSIPTPSTPPPIPQASRSGNMPRDPHNPSRARKKPSKKLANCSPHAHLARIWISFGRGAVPGWDESRGLRWRVSRGDGPAPQASIVSLVLRSGSRIIPHPNDLTTFLACVCVHSREARNHVQGATMRTPGPDS
jgi:hypothetical protein